jgi:hypothetical protein
MEALSSNLELHKKKFANITLQYPGSFAPRAPAPQYVVTPPPLPPSPPLPPWTAGGAANMRNSRNFEVKVEMEGGSRNISGVLFGNGTCKLSQVAIQPSHANVKPIFKELTRLINGISSQGPHSCITGTHEFAFKEISISLLKQQFKLPFAVKYHRVEELLAQRPLYFCDVSPNRPQTGQGVRFKLTRQLSAMLQVRNP